MKYVSVLLVVIAFTFVFAERGSGNVVSEQRDVSGFTGISLVAAGDIVITQGEQESVTIEAEDNLLLLLSSNVENGVLVLDTTENIQPTKDIRYLITVTTLDRLELSGAGDVSGTDLTLGTLVVDISGAGDVDLSGTANLVDVTISGAGDYQACTLQSSGVSIRISGQGDAVVAAADELSAEVSGMGDVAYVGDPQLSTIVSGMGEVTQIDACDESE